MMHSRKLVPGGGGPGRGTRRGRWLLLGMVVTGVAAVAALALVPATAAAQARVVVQVRTPEGKPAEGRVTLVPRGDGERHSCSTRAGKCSMEGVEGGAYKVHLDPADGEAPPPRKVMIPPAGKATLIVATAD